MATGVARRAHLKFASHLVYGELLSMAGYGLVDAASRYDGRGDGRFCAYARVRIWGTICDELGRLGIVPRHIYRDAKAQFRRESVGYSRVRCLRDPALGLHRANWLSEQCLDPFDRVVCRELCGGLRSAVDALPPKERFVVRRHYFDGERLMDVARELKVSKFVVSRLHARALRHLRFCLRQVGRRADWLRAASRL